jgi:gluconolactonase
MTNDVSARHVMLAEGLLFPEGPLVDLEGNIWCVELRGGALCCISTHGAPERHVVGGAPNGLALDQNGDLWFCDSENNEIRHFETATARVSSVLGSIDGRDLAAPNDLAFDAAGNLLFTCPGNSRKEPTGYVCCLSATGQGRIIADQLLFPNGLAFASGGDRLYLAETYRLRVSVTAWNSASPHTLSLSPCFDTPGPIGPDGLAIDASGRVHACIYGAGTVLIVSADHRQHNVPIPGGHPTNCAFDPLERFGLIVTEAARGSVLAFPGLGPGERPFIGRPMSASKAPT